MFLIESAQMALKLFVGFENFKKKVEINNEEI